MTTKPQSPGVFLPPPLIYALFFLASLLLQQFMPLNNHFFPSMPAIVISCCFFAAFAFFTIRALIRFVQSQNTVNTTKAAKSLQTQGIYSVSRNPMYTGLIFLYIGLALLVGNWWSIILLPAVVIIMQAYVIRREEKYLTHAFGEQYLRYKKKVRRWL